MKNRQIEILAPAGSFESLMAAVSAGADAVYIGGSKFGARAFANNLDEEKMLDNNSTIDTIPTSSTSSVTYRCHLPQSRGRLFVH